MSKIKISKEQATEEFQKFLDFSGYDPDEPCDELERIGINKSIEKLTYHVQKGVITINDSGHLTILTGDDDLPSITIDNHPKVTALRAGEKYYGNKAAAVAVIAETLGIGQPKINKLNGRVFLLLDTAFTFLLPY